jgi:hypothetical protein
MQNGCCAESGWYTMNGTENKNRAIKPDADLITFAMHPVPERPNVAAWYLQNVDTVLDPRA